MDKKLDDTLGQACRHLGTLSRSSVLFHAMRLSYRSRDLPFSVYVQLQTDVHGGRISASWFPRYT